MSDEMWPDIEGGLRSWLRADAGVAAALGGQRVFLEIPDDVKESSYPLVTVARVGGAQAFGQAPVDLPLVSVDVWGSLDANGRPRWLDLIAVVNAVRSALGRIDGRTTLTATTDAFGVQVAGIVRAPDPNNRRPRYVVTVEVAAIATTGP